MLPARSAAQNQPRIEVDMSLFAARNPFLLPGDDAVTLGGQIAGKASAEWPLDFRTRIETGGSLAYRQYTREYGNFLTGSAELALVHRRNEYLSLRTELSFERVLPVEAVASSLDSAIDPVSLQDRYEVAQGVTVHTDARTALNARLGWSRIDPRGSLLLTPTDAISLDFGAENRIDAATTLGLGGQITSSRSSSGGDPHAWAVQAKAIRRFPRAWNAEIEIGVTRLSRLTPGSGRESGPVQFSGNGSLCHEPGHIRFCASAAVASVVSSFGGIQREVSAATSLDWRSSERGRLIARGEYRRSPQSGGPGGNLPDIEVLSLTSRYEHRLDGQFLLYGGAEFQQRTGLSDIRLNSLTFRTGLLYRIPRP
nr:hypothetical protein [uncultured Novosphingobium sp.]